MKPNRTSTVDEAVNQAWLDWFASQMLAEPGPAVSTRSTARIACDYTATHVAADGEDEYRPNRRQRRFLSKQAAVAAGVALAAGIMAPTLAAASAPDAALPQEGERNHSLPGGYLLTADGGHGEVAPAPIRPPTEVAPARPQPQAPSSRGAEPRPALPQDPSATQPGTPGADLPYTQQQVDAMRDVLDKAELPGYVSLYSAKALRATSLSADVRRSLDKDAINAQMSQSFLNDQYNKDVRDGLRIRFDQSIDDIHNAKTPAGQDAAIARFNQTAREYNAIEVAERDAFGGHPTDAQGQIVRLVPKAAAFPTTVLADNGQVAANTLPAYIGQQAQAPANDAQSAGVPGTNADAPRTLPADLQSASAPGVNAAAPRTLPADLQPTNTPAVNAAAPQTSPADVQPTNAPGATSDAPRTLPADLQSASALGTDSGAPQSSSAGSQPASAEAPQTLPADVQPGVVAQFGQFGQQAGTPETPGASTPAGPGVNVTLASGNVQGDVFDASASGTTQFGDVTASGQVDARALGGQASASGGINGNGLNAQAAAQAYLGQIATQGSLQAGPVEVGGSAKGVVGADASANASLGPNGAQLGANAFVGAKVSAEGHADIGGVRAGVSGDVRFGLGAEARGTIGFTPDGKFTIGADAGVALGVGGKAGFSATVDPAKVYQTVRDAANSLNPFGTSSSAQQPQAQPEQPQAQPQQPQAEQPQAPADQPQAEQPQADQSQAQPEQPASPGAADQADVGGLDRGIGNDGQGGLENSGDGTDGLGADNLDGSDLSSDSLSGSGSDGIGAESSGSDSAGSDSAGSESADGSGNFSGDLGSGGGDFSGGGGDSGGGGASGDFSGDLGGSGGDLGGSGDLGGGGDVGGGDFGGGGGDVGGGDFGGGGGDFGGGGGGGDFGGGGGDFGGGGF